MGKSGHGCTWDPLNWQGVHFATKGDTYPYLDKDNTLTVVQDQLHESRAELEPGMNPVLQLHGIPGHGNRNPRRKVSQALRAVLLLKNGFAASPSH